MYSAKKMRKVDRDVSKRIIKSSLKRTSEAHRVKHQTNRSQKNGERCSDPTKLSHNISDNSHLFSFVNLLGKLNFKYEVLPDDQTKQDIFYMQDDFMNSFFKYYPEYLCFDILCQIPELNYSVIVLIGLDTNGHCEVVAIGLIKYGNLYGLAWFFEVFKKQNPSWTKIEFIISNESIDNREVLIRAFPNKQIFFSFFHAMKAFNNDLSNLDPVVNNQDTKKALHIFEQMFFISSELSYKELIKEMKQMHSIYTLFKKKWQPKKDFWALGFQFNSKIFLKAFNCFLLNIRNKTKHISPQESLESVIQNFHPVIMKLREEFFQKFTSMFRSPSSSYYSKSCVIQEYSKYLTPYATELVDEQLTLSERMRNVQNVDKCKYKINGCETIVSFNTCSCRFHTFMMLPCSHIFAVRNHLSLSLYVEPIRQTWMTKKYYEIFINLHSSFVCDKNEFEISEQSDRFRQWFSLSCEMWPLLLKCNEDVSQERLEIFQNVLKAWKSNFEIDVQVSEKQSDSSVNNDEELENLPTDYFKELYGISLTDILDFENEFSSIFYESISESL